MTRRTERLRAALLAASDLLWAKRVCIGAIVAALFLRALYLIQIWRIDLTDHQVFLADEGVFGLMGRHILQGARPIFYYGQNYLGALVAYVAAASFWLFGASMRTLRMGTALFAFAWIPIVYATTRRLYGQRAAFLAAALVAVPSQFVFEYGLKARSATEHATFVLILLYLVIVLIDKADMLHSTLFGLIAGLSLWVNQLVVGYIGLFGAALIVCSPLKKRHVVGIVVAGLIGMAPLIYGNIVEPFGTVRALAAEVQWTSKVAATKTHRDGHVPQYRAVPVLQVLGAQVRRDGRWSLPGSALAGFLLIGWAGGTGLAIRRRIPDIRSFALLSGSILMTLLVGISGFFGNPVGRYQLVLFPLLCVVAAGWIEHERRIWAVPVVAVLLIGQAGQLLVPIPSDGRARRGAVVRALLDRQLHYGYAAGYMQDLVFASKERVIIAPLDRSRYQPYEAAVVGAKHRFYIYRVDQKGKILHTVVMRRLREARAKWKRLDVGEYRILYDFQPPEVLQVLRPAEIRAEVRRLRRSHEPG